MIRLLIRVTTLVVSLLIAGCGALTKTQYQRPAIAMPAHGVLRKILRRLGQD